MQDNAGKIQENAGQTVVMQSSADRKSKNLLNSRNKNLVNFLMSEASKLSTLESLWQFFTISSLSDYISRA